MMTTSRQSRPPFLPASAALVVLLAAAALAGCSSGSSTTATGATSSTAGAGNPYGSPSSPSVTGATSHTGSDSTTSSSSSIPAAGPDGVAIAGFAFHPKSLTVKVGTTVTWKNDDQFAHQVRSTSGDPGVAFDLGAQNAGQTVSHQFTAPGTYRYYCNIHTYMTGTVVVTP